MHISNEGLELIKSCEGFSAHPYRDAAGYLTIGYGHLVKDGECFSEVTDGHAKELLIQDVREAEQTVRKLVSVKITQSQFDALVSFVFNIGSAAFAKSTLLKLLNAGDIKGAADQFDRWVYAGGRVLKGLRLRREKEKELFVSCL